MRCARTASGWRAAAEFAPANGRPPAKANAEASVAAAARAGASAGAHSAIWDLREITM